MFQGELVVQEARNGHGEWTLTSPLTYQGKYDEWVVPSGFSTDFASVPRFLWWLFPPYGRHTKAAVVHDYLYAERPLALYASRGKRGVPGYHTITRVDADGLFRRMMRELGVPAWRRWAMYLGVRLGGWVVWRRRRA